MIYPPVSNSLVMMIEVQKKSREQQREDTRDRERSSLSLSHTKSSQKFHQF
jgi:hypothetical protein